MFRIIYESNTTNTLVCYDKTRGGSTTPATSKLVFFAVIYCQQVVDCYQKERLS